MRNKSTSLTEDLFTKSQQQQLISLLFGQPHKDFNTNEIIKLTNVGSGAIQRLLEKFCAAGMIKVTILRNQKRYQANPLCPTSFQALANLQKLFCTTRKIANMQDKHTKNRYNDAKFNLEAHDGHTIKRRIAPRTR